MLSKLAGPIMKMAYGLGSATSLIILKEEMEDIKKIVKSFEDSGFLEKMLIGR